MGRLRGSPHSGRDGAETKDIERSRQDVDQPHPPQQGQVLVWRPSIHEMSRSPRTCSRALDPGPGMMPHPPRGIEAFDAYISLNEDTP